MVLRYLIIQMAGTSARLSGLGGNHDTVTESASRSSCRVLDLDLGNLPFEHQPPVALCDDHILMRPLKDPRINRSSPTSRIARIRNVQNAVQLPLIYWLNRTQTAALNSTSVSPTIMAL